MCKAYTYDTYGRVSTAKETVDGCAYQNSFSYNFYGEDYPSRFCTRKRGNTPSGFTGNYHQVRTW